MTATLRTTQSAERAELHAEVYDFYARQVRALDGLDVEGFAAYFADDGVMVHAHRDERIVGRDALISNARRSLPRYDGLQMRHWFQQFVIDPAEDGRIHVSYYTLVTIVDREGTVRFEPTFVADDVLVRQHGRLLVQSRVVHRDQPA